MVVTADERTAEVQHLRPQGLSAAPQTLRIVCLSSQSWRVDLPTNRQQVMTRVARSGHEVLYVETESFLGRHLVGLVRGAGRRSLLRRLVSSENAAPRVHVIMALSVLPWGHRSRLAARVNSALTSWVIRRRGRGSIAPTVLWIYDPCYSRCIGSAGERIAVYDCVDDYAEQAGSDPGRRKFVSECDADAAIRANLVFVTARVLAERHAAHNDRTHLVRNVGDFAHFAPAADRSLVSEDLASTPAPVIGFAGSLADLKIDFELLEALALSRPTWTFLLIGPVYGSTKGRVEGIASLDNVRWLGHVPYDDLPRYVAAFDVAIIPYVGNAYTRSCFPLKTFEYLAAGKPIVASGLPELAGMEPDVVLADGVESFVHAIEGALLRTRESDVVARQAVAAENTWETRTRRLLELVTSEL